MSRDRTARTRIQRFLATQGPVVDPSGYATTVLKDGIDYTGSSVAFIQLIAAMDRDGEIEREIRGKRTYRISGTETAAFPAAAPATPANTATTVQVPGQPGIELDYQQLAKALVRELLTATAAAQSGEAGPVAAEADAEHDRLVAERDEYMRRLEIARRQLDELLGGPVGPSVSGADPADRVSS